MPDKRQTSKQRRASRNRASRDALAARRTNALAGSTTGGSSRASSAASSSGGTGAAGPAANGAATGGAGGLRGILRGPRRPGDLAVVVALGLAIVSAVSVLFLTRIPVDDRGEPLPQMFRGVAIAAREAVTGQEIPDRKEGLLEASGPGVLLYLALPIAVAGFAFWANRRPDRGRLLTFAMLAMAGVVILAGGAVFFPTLIALAVASFQVRKADMPARAAERVTRTGRRGRGEVIDADSEEVDAGAGDGDEAVGDAADDLAPDDADPLAQLEAEIEAEDRAGKRPGGDTGGAAPGE